MIERRLVSRPVSTIGTLIAPRVTQQEGPPIVTEGLVLHLDAGNPYSYNGTSSTITDLSGNGNNGTLLNTPTFEADRNGILSFDGSNDNINCGRGASLTIADNISCAFWIKWPTGYGNSGWQSVVTKRRPFSSTLANRQATLVINWNPTENWFQVQFYSPAGTSRALLIPLAANFSVNEWTHVIAVLEKSGSNTIITVYKNGSQLDTTTVGANVLAYSNLDLRIAGMDNSYSAPFGLEYGLCRMAQVLLYNRALSAAEVFQNYQATRWRFGI